MHMRPRTGPVRIGHHAPAHRSRGASTRAQDGRSVIRIGATPAPFVRAATRWISRSEVVIAWCPPHAEPSHRFRSRDQDVGSMGAGTPRERARDVATALPLSPSPHVPAPVGRGSGPGTPRARSARHAPVLPDCPQSQGPETAYQSPTLLTAVDRQATPARGAHAAGCAVCCLAVRARQASGMDMLCQPRTPLVILSEVYDRTIHALDCTNFAPLV